MRGHAADRALAVLKSFINLAKARADFWRQHLGAVPRSIRTPRYSIV